MNFPVVQLLTKEAQYTSDSRFSPLAFSLSLSTDCGGWCRFFIFRFFAFVCARAAALVLERGGTQFVISSLPLDGIFSAAPHLKGTRLSKWEKHLDWKKTVCALFQRFLHFAWWMGGDERWDCRRAACNFIKRQLVDLNYGAAFLFFSPQRADFYGAIGSRPRGQFLDHRFFTWLSEDEWRDLL